jgi:hypothetical protein
VPTSATDTWCDGGDASQSAAVECRQGFVRAPDISVRAAAPRRDHPYKRGMTDRSPAARHRSPDRSSRSSTVSVPRRSARHRDALPCNCVPKAVHFDGLIYTTGLCCSTRVADADCADRSRFGRLTIDGRRRDASDALKWLRGFGGNAKGEGERALTSPGSVTPTRANSTPDQWAYMVRSRRFRSGRNMRIPPLRSAVSRNLM